MNSIAVPNSCCRSSKQIDDLTLDGDIQRAHRLIAHQQLGAEHHGARDADALALAAAELVRVARARRRREADPLQHSRDPRSALARRERGLEDLAAARPASRPRSCADSSSRADPERRFAGRGDAGAWRGRRSVRRSSPLQMTAPREAGIRRRMARARVDLPEPDSPTRPTVSPRATSKLTASSARARAEIHAQAANLKEWIAHGSSG